MDRRTRSVVALACLVMLASGCAQVGASGRPAASDRPTSSPSVGAASPSVAALPSASPAAVAGPAPRIRIIGSEPVLRGRSLEGYSFVLPGAAIEHDGMIHAFLVWFTEEPGTQVVTHASSPDGRAWTVDPGPLFTDLGLALERPGPIPADVFVEPDGTWVMYGWGSPASAPRTFVGWRATAPGPMGPWVAQRNLLPSAAGGWDDNGVILTSAVRTADGYELYYEGSSRQAPSTSRLGLARSADGIGWTRVAPPGSEPGGAPVFEPGQCAGMDRRTVTMPNVTLVPEGRLMLYTGFEGREAAVGAATSTDGLAWRCAGSEPVIRADDVPGSQGIHTVELFERSSGPTLLIESLGDGTSDVWLAGLTPP